MRRTGRGVGLAADSGVGAGVDSGFLEAGAAGAESAGVSCCAIRERVIAVQRAEMITTVFFMRLKRELMFSLRFIRNSGDINALLTRQGFDTDEHGRCTENK